MPLVFVLCAQLCFAFRLGQAELKLKIMDIMGCAPPCSLVLLSMWKKDEKNVPCKNISVDLGGLVLKSLQDVDR